MRANEEVFSFTEQERLGRIGANIVVRALNSLPDWRVDPKPSAVPEQKRLGFDYVAQFRGNKCTVEIKTDMRGYRTDNIALETHDDRDDGTKRAGWMSTTTAGYIVSLLIEQRGLEAFHDGCPIDRSARLYVMSTQAIQSKIGEWRGRYKSFGSRNEGYTTRGIPVPVEVIRAAGLFVAEYGVAYRNVDGAPQVTAVVRPTNGRPFTITHRA